jgi:integrase
MAVYKRGEVWWFEFVFRGQRIRESSAAQNKAVAQRIERERRRQLELGNAGLKESKQAHMFSVASKRWLDLKRPHWSASSAQIESYSLGHLMPHFGRMLLTDISADDVSRYQASRKKAGASAKTINLEVGTLRGVLRKHRLWANIQPDVKMLRAREDVGRALSADEEHRLLIACKKSLSRSLPVAVQVALHTGLRLSELRLLRWRQIDLLEKSLRVGKSKTAAGEGRIVPLSDTAANALQEWRGNFPGAIPAHYVFPAERYRLSGAEGAARGKVIPYMTNPEKPIGSWKTAWTTARRESKVSCRWHDMRHCFVSHMAESQASDATIMALAGHLSRKMMERYSHTRAEAKRDAIAVLDKVKKRGSHAESPQIPPQ